MELTVLGSSGNTPIPMPTCQCRVCREARAKGKPYTRRGNSVYIHDDNVLIDTPEHVWQTLNDEAITDVDHILLSHHHFDHVLGLRSAQSLAREGFPIGAHPINPPTLWIGSTTYEEIIEANESFQLLTDDWTDVVIVEDGDTIDLDNLHIRVVAAPMRPSGPPAMYNFLVEDHASTAFIAPDETKFLDLDRVPAVDLLIHETGLFQYGPDGDKIVADDYWAEDTELETTFEETLSHVEALDADHVLLTEIEETYQRSYDDYKELEAEHPLRFAHDGQRVVLD